MPKTNTKYTSQHIDNQSFDDDFQVKLTGHIKYDDPANPTSISRTNLATEETLQSLLAASGGGAYETRIDEVSATVSYIGKAVPGSATSAASWQITKLDETTGLVLSYADDVTTFTKIWDNRASYTY